MGVFGKLLIFLSFFLVAPELLGSGRLKNYLERKHTTAIGFLAAWFGLVSLLALAYAGLRHVFQIDVNPLAIGGAITGWSEPEHAPENKVVGQIAGVVFLGLVLAMARLLRNVVDDRIVMPTIERAEKDEAFRRRLAEWGVWCFVIGSLLDLAAELLK